jgi:hypothetical protein
MGACKRLVKMVLAAAKTVPNNVIVNPHGVK